jgi:hypothetical protein
MQVCFSAKKSEEKKFCLNKKASKFVGTQINKISNL